MICMAMHSQLLAVQYLSSVFCLLVVCICQVDFAVRSCSSVTIQLSVYSRPNVLKTKSLSLTAGPQFHYLHCVA